MALFRTWLEKAYKTLEDKERQLANLNKVQGSIDDIKAFVGDVMTHGADLKFLTISGQKFVDLSKVGVTLAFHCYLQKYLLPHVKHDPISSVTYLRNVVDSNKLFALVD